MHKIRLISVFFGPLPSYFDLWLATAGRNHSVDWSIVTDQEVSGPDNVEVCLTTFSDLRDRFQRHFDFPIALHRPYKLCDFKPAYGELFAGLVSDYDYWGHVDVDVIWGNLRHFLAAEKLSSSDKIFGGGHLSLYRNDPVINGMFRNTAQHHPLSYREVFGSDVSYAFDEWGPQLNGMNVIVGDNGGNVYMDSMPYADIKVHSKGLRSTREEFGSTSQRSEELGKRNIAFSYQDGALLQHWITASGEVASQEEAYIHLQKRPMRRSRAVRDGSDFVILPPNRILPHPGHVDADLLRRHARESGIYPHSLKIRGANLRRRLKGMWR